MMKKLRLSVNAKEWLILIAIFSITFSALMTCLHFIRFPSVDGHSMEPTYSHGAQLVTLYTKNVDINDVIVIYSETLDQYIVKRVIGMPGDHIEIKNKKLYRNDVALYEDYIYEHDWVDFYSHIDIVIPEGEIFVMGDNRNESTDSRHMGALRIDDVFGKVLFENKLFIW